MGRPEESGAPVSDRPREVARAIGTLVELGSVGLLVEVGCGDGRLAIQLAERIAAGGSVLALDANRLALERARSLAHRAGIKRVEFRRGDAFDLPLGDGVADLAVCSSLLCSVARPEAAVREMCRIVRPGGAVVAAEPAGPQLFEDPEDERFARLSAKLNLALHRGWRQRGADQEIGLRVPGIFVREGLRDLAVEGICQVHLLADRRRTRGEILEQLRVEAAPLPPGVVGMVMEGGMSRRELDEQREKARARLDRFRSDPRWTTTCGYIRVMQPLIVTAARKRAE